jgi:hypothetical protein
MAKVTLMSFVHPSMPARAAFAPPAPAYGVKGGSSRVTYLCRNCAGTGDNCRLHGTTEPRRKFNSHNASVVCSGLLFTPPLGLRILSRKGCGFDSRRSHLSTVE